MKVKAHLFVLVVVLPLVTFACRSGSGAESDVGSEPPPVAPGFAGIDLGALIDFELSDESEHDFVRAPPGEGPTFELLGCREVWPRLYVLDFDWTPTAEVDLPLEAYLGWAFTSSDVISITTYRIVLDTGGQFSVPIDDRENPTNPAEGIWTGQRSPFRGGLGCYGDIVGDGISGGWHGFAEPRVDPVDLTTAAPAGTLEHLIGGVVPGDISDPLLPVADLYARSANLPIDQVYLDVDNTLSDIQVRAVGSCVQVASGYEDGLRVLQSSCEPTADYYLDQYPIVVEEAPWHVRVGGVESYQLESLTLGRG